MLQAQSRRRARANGGTSSNKCFRTFQIADGLYVLGAYERGVTVYSQQIRALNLGWAMIERLSKKQLEDIAIVGGGFSGLTLACALISKGVPKVTIFEKRPVLCPLQEGSDTRWLHPRVTDWPADESDLPNASLPLLNWTAGRASDVVAQILSHWTEFKKTHNSRARDGRAELPRIREEISTRYLKVEPDLRITWVAGGSSDNTGDRATGQTKTFSSIVLAVGFGE